MQRLHIIRPQLAYLTDPSYLIVGYSVIGWVGQCRGVVRTSQVLRAVKRSLGVGTDLLDPGVGLGLSVVYGDFLVEDGVAEGLGRIPPISHAGQTGLQNGGVGHGIGLSDGTGSSAVRSVRVLSVGMMLRTV